MVFNQLKALVDIIQLMDVEKIEDFSTSQGKKESLTLRLYAILKEGISDDEEVIAKKLFGEEINNSNYRVLKNRTKKQLLSAVLNSSVNNDKYSESFREWYRISKEMLVAELLLKLGKRSAGIEMILDIYKDSVHYHLTEFKIKTLEHLRTHYSLTGEKQKYNQTKEDLYNAIAIGQAEAIAVSLYEDVTILYSNKHSERPENLPLALEKLAQIRELFEQYDSYKIKDMFWRLSSIIGQINLNYEMVIQSIDEVTSYLTANPHLTSKTKLGHYSLEKLNICFSLRKFDEAIVAVQQCEQFTTFQTRNWLSFKKVEVMLNLHIGREEEAWDIVQKVKKSLDKSSDGVEKYISEWKILEGYCYYARITAERTSGKKTMATYPNPVRVFAGGFLEFFEDKEGANLSILICHILLISLLPNEKTDLSNKIALLDRYRYRNLTSQYSKRGAYFIELLRLMVRTDFNRAKSMRLAMPILAKMKEISIVENYEVLPFEKVWEEMILRLTK